MLDLFYAYPDHGYAKAEALEKQIEDALAAFSAKFGVPKPLWNWTAINTHFEPREQTIFISDYVVNVWNQSPALRNTISEVVSWEVAHSFKHYLDNYKFLKGDKQGAKVIRHVERKRWLLGMVPKFEEEATTFAIKTTGLVESHYDQLYSSIQPWNIPGYQI